MNLLFFIAVIIIYLGLNYFIWKRTMSWFHNIHTRLRVKWFTILFTIFHVLLATAPVTCYLFKDIFMKAAAKYISNVWIGIFIYALIFMAASSLITLILKMAKKVGKSEPGWRRFVVIRGAIVAVLIIGFSTYGMFHVGNIKTSVYNVSVDKTCAAGKNLKIVLVADMHMGYSIGEKQIAKMAEKINAQNPDLVCIAGDIFDNDYSALQNPEQLESIYRSIKSKYGVYACYGNHDVEEDLVGGFTVPSKDPTYNEDDMYQFLKNANIKLLEDKTQLVADAFYVVGRRDYTKPGTTDGTRASVEALMNGLDQSKPVFVLDHQPKDLQEMADAGVDIDLSGHTHNGQIFPGNLIIELFWENACGYLKKDKMHSVVTSGVGVWGPAMRVGTDSEIAVVNVTFK